MCFKSTKFIVCSWFTATFLGLFLYSKPVQSAVVLQYHHISDNTPEITSLSPELFAHHLEYLHANQFKVLSLETFIHHLERADPFPDKSVLITFDDGYRSIFDIAFPMLKKYNFPFTVFVNTDPLEQKLEQFMTWEELQTIIDYGGAIANHSVSHPHMIPKQQNQPIYSKSKSNQQEVTKAEKLLSMNLTKYHKVFAYPYGEFDNQVKADLVGLGYIAFGQHSGAVGNHSDKLALPRFPFGGRFGKMEDFILKVNSQALEVKGAVLLDENDKILDSQLIPNTVERTKLFIRLDESQDKLVVNCFASDGSQLKSKKYKSGWVFILKTSKWHGRGRINCTAASEIPDSYFWYSLPLVKADESGNYY